MTEIKIKKLITNWLSMAYRDDIISVLLKDFKDGKLSEDSLLVDTCKKGSIKNKVDIPIHEDCLEYPYSMEEANELYDAQGFISGLIRLSLDDILTETGESIAAILVSKLVDGNVISLMDEIETEIAGCDENGLYFHVCCNASPYIFNE